MGIWLIVGFNLLHTKPKTRLSGTRPWHPIGSQIRCVVCRAMVYRTIEIWRRSQRRTETRAVLFRLTALVRSLDDELKPRQLTF